MGRLLVAIYVLYEHLCDELSVLPLVNTAMIIYLWCVDALPYDRDRFGFTISSEINRYSNGIFKGSGEDGVDEVGD